MAAIAIPAMEAFATFDERLASAASGMTPAAGRLLPGDWENRRREVRNRGLVVEPAAWTAVAQWARRLAVDLPEPLADGS